MASSLWLSGAPPPGDTALKALLTPAPTPLLEKYLSLSEDLAIDLPSPGMGRGLKRQPERGVVSKIESERSECKTDLLPGKRARLSSELPETDLIEEWGTSGTMGKVPFTHMKSLVLSWDMSVLSKFLGGSVSDSIHGSGDC